MAQQMRSRLVNRFLWIVAAMACACAVTLQAQRPAFAPVTNEMLLNPGPDDWLMYSRTYDAQRFSPLTQITRANVSQLRQVFKVEFGMGTQQSIPLVYRGVLYMIVPGAAVRALDATTGATIWEHRRPDGAPQSRAKALAIYEDMVYYTAPDGVVVALDARTGDVRWEVKTTGRMTSGALVVEGRCSWAAPARPGARTATSRRTTRRRAARPGASTRRPARTTRAATPGPAHREPRAGVHLGPAGRIRSGAAAHLLGRLEPDAEHARRPARRQHAAIPRAAPAELYSNSTSRCVPTPGNWSGTTSTCPATTGTWTSAREDAHPDGHRPRPRAREVDQPRRPARSRA
jgi:hypothetical protein